MRNERKLGNEIQYNDIVHTMYPVCNKQIHTKHSYGTVQNLAYWPYYFGNVSSIFGVMNT